MGNATETLTSVQCNKVIYIESILRNLMEVKSVFKFALSNLKQRCIRMLGDPGGEGLRMEWSISFAQ